MRRILAFIVCGALLAPPAAASAAGLRTNGALFVSDAAARTVARFPLVDDIPIGTPEGILRTAYVPGRVAVEATGVLYVADRAAAAVDVYASGAARRAHPIRVLVPSQAPVSLALDAERYLYVGEAGGQVEIYAPGASGKATPVQVVRLSFGSAAVDALAVDTGGRLYAAQNVRGSGGVVSEYGNPRTQPAFLRGLGGIGGEAPFIGIDGLATDPTGELYVSQTGWVPVWALSESACCAFPADRLIVAPTENGGNTVPMALAVRGRHVFLLSGSGGNHGTLTPAIYVFDALRARQTPLETVSGAFLADPTSLAVTP